MAPVRLPLFDLFTREEAHLLRALMTLHLAPEKSLLVARGGAETALYFICRGRIAISCNAKFATHKTLLRQSPCLAGEVDVLSERGAVLFVRAETKLIYLKLSAEALGILTRTKPDLALRLLAALSRRARSLADGLEQLHARGRFGMRRPAHMVKRFGRRPLAPRARRLGLAKARGEIV